MIRAANALLNLIPAWLWSCLLIAAGVVNCAGSHKLERARAQVAGAKAELLSVRAQAQDDVIEAMRFKNLRERELKDEINSIQFNARQRIAVMREHAATAERGRLRDAASAAAASQRQRVGSSSFARAGNTDGDAIGVFARLLGEVDDHAGALADYAGQCALGWQACASSYAAVECKVAGRCQQASMRPYNPLYGGSGGSP